MARNCMGTHEVVNKNADLTQVIQNLFDKVTSTVYLNSNTRDWLSTIIVVRQSCLLSLTLFNIFLEVLKDHKGTANTGGTATH